MITRTQLLTGTALLLFPATAFTEEPTTETLVVLGSSVAAGHGAGKPEDSWASRLGHLLEKEEPVAPGAKVQWKFANASIPGDNTVKVLGRYDKDLLAAHPDADIVVIALSLANEGMVHAAHPQEVFDHFRDGLEKIAARVRQQGAYPVFTLAYSQNTYTPEQYGYVKKMNLLLNAGASPCINFLGALDDGRGHWAPGHFFDDGHPNSQGYGEFFYAIVPSLFDAIGAGKRETPHWQGTEGYLHLERDPDQEKAPLSFRPAQTVHSFTQSFRVRTGGTGTIAAIGSGGERATLEARDSSLVYIGPGGTETGLEVKIQDGQWHDVALSHRYATGELLIYVDGVLKSEVKDHIAPDLFVLGGPASTKRAAAPEAADYQDLAIYRAAWTQEEAQAQHEGALQQASMEICAPLADAAPKKGEALENRAQSLSQVILETERFAAKTKAH